MLPRNHRVSDWSRPTLAAGRRRSHQGHTRARSGRDRDGRPRPCVGRSSTPGLDARALERAHASGALDCPAPLAAADCDAAEFGFADADASRRAAGSDVVRGNREPTRRVGAASRAPRARAGSAGRVACPAIDCASRRGRSDTARLVLHRLIDDGARGDLDGGSPCCCRTTGGGTCRGRVDVATNRARG